MQTKINKISESQIEIDFELSSDEFKEFEKKAISEIKKDFEIDGFRKGKAPEDFILKNIGKEKIVSEAANIAIQESFTKFVLENTFEIISKPEATIVKIAEGNPFQFKIKVSIIPNIELPDYKEIAKKVERKKIEVLDSEIEEALKWAQKSRAKFSLKDSSSEKGDFIEIEYSTPESGEKKYNDAFILGDGHFLAGFENDLIGMKNGEEKKGLKAKTKEGKETTADVKVIAVKKLDIPELNDDFVKSLGNFQGIEDLKKNIRDGLKLEKENAEKQRIRNKIVEKIALDTKIEIPEELKEREKEVIKKDLQKRVKETLNIEFEEYLTKINKTENEINQSVLQEAERKIKSILILREISKKENLEISDEELEEEVNHFLSHYHNKEEIGLTPEELKERIKESLMYEKTFKVLENYV